MITHLINQIFKFTAHGVFENFDIPSLIGQVRSLSLLLCALGFLSSILQIGHAWSLIRCFDSSVPHMSLLVPCLFNSS